MAISEELELDISGALDAIESLNEPLTALGENLTITLTTAIEAVDVQPLADQLAAIDAAGLTTTIDASIEAADGTVPIEADTDAVPGEIDASIASADTTVALEADTSDFGGSIDEALAAADATIVVEADVGDIAGEIEGEIASADTTVTLETDADGLSDFTTGVDSATDSVGGLSTAAAGLVGGDVLGTMTSSIGKAGPIGAVAAAGLAAATGGILALVNAGIDAQSSQQRFNQTFGAFADEASKVNLGTLNTNLSDLAISLGSDDEALLDAAASLAQFASAGQLAEKQGLELVNSVSALAARAVALNPALGGVGENVAGLTGALARGGRPLNKFGISLNKVDIQARAATNAAQGLGDGISQQSLSLAGAQLAAEKYGRGIEDTIGKGTRQASVQQRSLNEQLSNFLEEAGKPLVAPFLEFIKNSLPIVKALAPVLADLGKEALPALAQSLKDSTPLIKAFGDFMHLLAPIIGPLQKLINLTIAPVLLLTAAFDKIGELPDIAGFFDGIVEAIGGIPAAIGDIPGAVSDLIGSLGGAGDGFGDLSDSILGFIGDIPGAVTDVFGSIASDVADGLGRGSDAILGFFSALPGRIVDVLQALPGLVVDAFIQTMTDAAAAVIIGSLTVVAAIGTLPGKIVEALQAATGLLITAGTELIQGLIDGVTVAIPAVVGFFQALPGRIVGFVGDVTTTLTQAGTTIVNGFVAGVTTAFEAVIAFFKALPGAVVGFVGDVTETLKQTGIDIISGFLSGVSSAFQFVLGFVQSIPGAIKRGIGNVLTGAKSLVSVGVDLIRGLINGIIEKAKDIPGTIVDKVVKQIPKGVRDFFKSDSPSRLMMDIGRDITAGLAIGIEDGASQVASAIDQVSSEAVKGMAAIPAVLPIPGISKLPAVVAALPVSVGSAAASTAGPVTSAQADLQGIGAGIHIEQLVVQTAAKDQTQVGIEVSRQLRAESFRAGR